MFSFKTDKSFFSSSPSLALFFVVILETVAEGHVFSKTNANNAISKCFQNAVFNYKSLFSTECSGGGGERCS